MDKRTHKDIKNLFEHRNSEPLDDFEKEALEGFDILGSEQEAMDLKAELDKEIQSKQLFSPATKPSGLKVYWYAAAGLVLAIGFTIYFITNSAVLNKEPGVAQSTTTPNEKAAAPEGMLQQPVAREESDKSPVPPPPVQTAKETVSEKKSEGKIAPEAEISDEKNIANKNVIASNKNQDQLLSRKQNDNEDDLDQKVKAEEQIISGKIANEKAKDNEANLLDRASGTGANTPVTATEENQLLKSEAKGGKKKKNVAAAQSAPVPAESPSSGAYGYEPKREKEVPKKTADTKAVQKQDQGERLANDALETENDVCFYTGGQSQLQKDLQEKLSAKNISKKFDAALFINKNKKVSDVKFTNTYDLTESEIKDVKKILQSLKHFNYSIKPQDTHQYQLEYRPFSR